jgi:hypothetical protein
LSVTDDPSCRAYGTPVAKQHRTPPRGRGFHLSRSLAAGFPANAVGAPFQFVDDRKILFTQP